MASPAKLSLVGSKDELCCWPLITRMARPTMPAAKTSRVHQVERTLRSLSHSIWATVRKP